MKKNQYSTDDNYKWVVYTLIFPIINWFIFFIEDYTNERIIKRIDIWGGKEEFNNISLYIRVINTLTRYCLIIFPILVGVVLFVYVIKNRLKIKNHLIMVFSWFVINVIYYLFFVELVKVNINIIHQNSRVFLNGVEYLFVPFEFAVTSIIVLYLLFIIYCIVQRIKNKKF